MNDNKIVIVRHENAGYSEAYNMVMEAFRLAGYDSEHYGTPDWNPLGVLISPGDRVVLKPNMVTHKNHLADAGTECLYTQPQVVRPVIDYALKALDGEGSIIVGDAPVQECDFAAFIETSGYKSMIDSYRDRTGNVIIELKDLRGVHSYVKNGVHYYAENEASRGVNISLGSTSLFAGERADRLERLRITNYAPAILKSYHDSERHIYSISREVLEADVIISLPKPKTHRKAGLTIALKNSIGMISRKECIPHHTNGSPKYNGDQYANASVMSWIANKLDDLRNYLTQTRKNYIAVWPVIQCLSVINKLSRRNRHRDGSWLGNDTICRSIADINRCIFYADIYGRINDTRQRKYLVIADMIISGEHNGPLSPQPKHNGIIALGENPVSFDEVMSFLMGIKQEYFRTLEYAKQTPIYSGQIPEIVSNDRRYDGKSINDIKEEDILFFRPPDEWVGAFFTSSEHHK